MTRSRSSMEAIARTFALGDEVEAVRFAARGAMGSIFYVRTEQREWAVKELFDWWDDSGVEDEAAFVDAARTRGVHAPAIVRSTTGSIIAVVDGVGVRVYEWVSNEGSPSRPITDACARDAGRILAQLHATAIARDDEPDPWYLSRHRGLPWPAFAEQFADDPLGERLSSLSEELDALDRLAAEHPTGPWQCCHRDFDPTNVLLDLSGRLVVVDWENAGPLDATSEIGYSVLGWASEPDGDPIPGTVTSFFDGYASVRDVPMPDGPRAFSVGVSARLNFVAVSLEIVSAQEFPQRERERSRDIANRMLTALPSRDRLERYLEIWASTAAGRP